ncbi:hypothetical protein ACFVT2_42980 [Streptomyces sp. NPDC058000]|uniref:hypothetical protein n=1 Tax=Streptomyces sp. NPDC058000 TaxID=3346299 RepID=UPI0036F135F3
MSEHDDAPAAEAKRAVEVLLDDDGTAEGNEAVRRPSGLCLTALDGVDAARGSGSVLWCSRSAR